MELWGKPAGFPQTDNTVDNGGVNGAINMSPLTGLANSSGRKAGRTRRGGEAQEPPAIGLEGKIPAKIRRDVACNVLVWVAASPR